MNWVHLISPNFKNNVGLGRNWSLEPYQALASLDVCSLATGAMQSVLDISPISYIKHPGYKRGGSLIYGAKSATNLFLMQNETFLKQTFDLYVDAFVSISRVYDQFKK